MRQEGSQDNAPPKKTKGRRCLKKEKGVNDVKRPWKVREDNIAHWVEQHGNENFLRLRSPHPCNLYTGPEDLTSEIKSKINHRPLVIITILRLSTTPHPRQKKKSLLSFQTDVLSLSF